ncbi:Putative Lipocalin-like domain-containing protein [Septoria linicola]|uniref:Lipocalin-like domain-containing protein n=1 Tax=Septoria linicola TaxID=215465 RepID=A0A9Q9ADM8_9PEZI|nr:putative Lipocalin-like domain-containing protein [Septoria linicola]USW47002.1 Putative Lipocalin-like domain-containing protein [Septoria linicola]
MSAGFTTNAIVHALAGTYALINTTSTLNGVAVPDRAYGKSPVGLLTYTKSGFMSATITATEADFRPSNLTFPYNETDPTEDWALVGQHTLAYAGPWSVSPDLPVTNTSGQLIHGPLWVANVPSWTGSEQRRNFSVHTSSLFDGYPKGTKLLRIESIRDNGNAGVLWWRRVDGESQNGVWRENTDVNLPDPAAPAVE